MHSQYFAFKKQAINLRQKGKTYGEIKRMLNSPIPKSTLSCWFRGLVISRAHNDRLQSTIAKNIKKAQSKALLVNNAKRDRYFREIIGRNDYLSVKFKDKDTAKIALTMLYLGEGSKHRRGSLVFGNSDPFIIVLFLYLLRFCYSIDESKFRCTVQCRADQDTNRLNGFWSKITGIHSRQFYKARIDPRTIGKPSKKSDYKGVCRIDYFSADIYNELMQIPKIIYKGPVAQR